MIFAGNMENEDIFIKIIKIHKILLQKRNK